MAKQDFKNGLSVTASLTPAARTASANGTGVDLANVAGAEVVFAAGTRTDGTHTPSVEESADNATFTAVAAADLLGSALVAITSNSLQMVGYIGTKRYIRAVVTVSGATTGAVYGATVITHSAHKQP